MTFEESINKTIEIKQLLASWNCESVFKEAKNLNSRYMPINQFKVNEENAEKWNKVMILLFELIDAGEIKSCKMTSRGYISKARKNGFNYGNYKILKKKNQIIVYIFFDRAYKLIWGRNRFEDTGLTGTEAFNEFEKKCKDYEINLERYAENDIEKAKQIADEGPSSGYCDMVDESATKIDLDNMHHLDINSAYPAGLAATHREFRPLIYHLYDIKQNTNSPAVKQHYKDILNKTTGMFASDMKDYKFAKLRNDAISWSNSLLDKVAMIILENGGLPISFNTDGIWFQADAKTLAKIKKVLSMQYLLGNDIGQFKLDHENVTCLFKSAGCYQFLENGIVYTKAKGIYTLELTKPRNKDGTGWDWGDILYTPEIRYRLTDERRCLVEVIYES